MIMIIMQLVLLAALQVGNIDNHDHDQGHVDCCHHDHYIISLVLLAAVQEGEEGLKMNTIRISDNWLGTFVS